MWALLFEFKKWCFNGMTDFKKYCWVFLVNEQILYSKFATVFHEKLINGFIYDNIGSVNRVFFYDWISV